MEAKPLQETKYETEDIEYELESTNVKKRDTLFLWIIVVTGSMISVFDGMSLVWPSSALPKMKSNNTNINPIERPITTLEISLLAGLPTLSMLLGSIVCGYLSEKVGRKGTLQIAGVGIFISITALAFNKNIIGIIAFRCAWFFFCHGGFSVLLVYITEISEDHNRAKFGCLAATFLPFGQIIGYGLGALLNFRNFILAELFPLVIFVFFIFFAPESPVYSLSNNKIEKCTRALKKLRNNKNDKELKVDLRCINDTIMASKIQKGNVSLVDLFNSKEKRYALMLAFLPIFIKLCCGLGIIMPFMEPIFIAADTKYNSSRMPIIAAVFKILSYLTTSFTVEKYGRKLLLLISSLGSGVSLLVLGCFFYLKSTNSPTIYQLQWLPLACVISYVIMFAAGMGAIPLVTMSELFTPDIRSMGVAFLLTLFSILLFCSSSTYPYIVEYLGMHWCFWIYGGSTLLGTILMYVIIPENKGKSIVEIQEYIKLRVAK